MAPAGPAPGVYRSSAKVSLLGARQEGVQLAGEFFAEAGGFGDLLRGGGAEFVERTEVREQRDAADRTEAGKIVENAFLDLPRAEIRVVGVGEAVRLIAQPLQQVQPPVAGGQVERFLFVGKNDGLLLLLDASAARRHTLHPDKPLSRAGDRPPSALDAAEV